MDLVGRVQYIESRLGERKPGQGKGRSDPDRNRNVSEENAKPSADERHVVPDYDAHIGRIIDTSA